MLHFGFYTCRFTGITRKTLEQRSTDLLMKL